MLIYPKMNIFLLPQGTFFFPPNKMNIQIYVQRVMVYKIALLSLTMSPKGSNSLR